MKHNETNMGPNVVGPEIYTFKRYIYTMLNTE